MELVGYVARVVQAINAYIITATWKCAAKV